MRRGKRRWAPMLLVMSVLAFVAIGAPVVADKLITGRDIAPGAIGRRELANGSVSSRKLSRRLRRSLAGRAGARGANGGQGPQGPAGPRGAAGAFNFVDATGRTVGPAAGFYSGIYPMVLLPSGVIVLFDNDPTTTSAVALLTTLYYQDAACAGTPFANGLGQPIQSAVIPQSTALPGSTIYQMFGTLQRFTAAGQRTNGACAPSTTRVSGFEVRAVDTVPAVAKPFSMVPAS